MLKKNAFNDQQLVTAIQNGQKEAMIQLYKDNYPAIRSYILKNNGRLEDVDDILQDTCIVLWEKIKRNELELKAKIKTIAFAIAKNLWLKRLNKASRMQSISGLNLDSEKMSVNTDNLKKIDLKIVGQLLDLLGEKCKAILSLFYYEGQDMQSIAEILSYNNADTVKAKKHQCFKQLQTQFLSRYKRSDF